VTCVGEVFDGEERTETLSRPRKLFGSEHLGVQMHLRAHGRVVEVPKEF
jgi:hypothetical protein